MIYGSLITLKVGEILQPDVFGYEGIRDYEGNLHPPQPVLVARKATSEEYLAQFSPNSINYHKTIEIANNKFMKFYELQLD